MSRPTPRSRLYAGLLILSSGIGLVDSTLIHLKEIASATDPNAFKSCKINAVIDCAPVAASRYAHIFGLPVSLLGIYFYEALFVLGIVLLVGLALRRWQIWIISSIALGAFFFSFRLLYFSYFGVGALCPYCLVSNASTAVAVLSWFLFLRHLTNRPAPPSFSLPK